MGINNFNASQTYLGDGGDTSILAVLLRASQPDEWNAEAKWGKFDEIRRHSEWVNWRDGGAWRLTLIEFLLFPTKTTGRNASAVRSEVAEIPICRNGPTPNQRYILPF